MPTKTINFSDKAWRIIDSWDNSISVSARVSAALLKWHSEMLDSERYRREAGLEE